MGFAVVFAIVALQIGFLAWLAKSLVLGWVAVVTLGVAVVYYLRAGTAFGKRDDGSIALHAWPLWLPFFTYSWFAHLAYRSVMRERVADLVAPNLYVGRRPRLFELPADVTLIIDLCAEFPASRGVRGKYEYVAIPTLDATAPTAENVMRALAAIEATKGAVFIHCAFGHGRSALVAGAAMVARGDCNVAEVERTMQQKRPRIRMSPGQRRSLAALEPALLARRKVHTAGG